MKKGSFLAFIGPDIRQPEPIREIQDGYECWNLRTLAFGDFIKDLQAKIPPINDNVLRNYELRTESKDIYGITEKDFGDCSWGLLIPDALDDVLAGGYAETMFLINLYSPEFLYPAFHGSDFGIMRPSHHKHRLEYFSTQNQAHVLSTKEFVSFFKLLLPQSQYGTWQLYRAQKWQDEDWRLFVAALLFAGLKEYDNGKGAFGWQREAADMASILEALFTAEDITNDKIGYRLRKRVAVLLSEPFPSIEGDVKELYGQRSAFVHGSFFAKIAEESKGACNNLPIPDFKLLQLHKYYVRWAFVAYLHLAHVMNTQPTRFGQVKNVMTALDQATKNAGLRNDLLLEAKTILNLMPK